MDNFVTFDTHCTGPVVTYHASRHLLRLRIGDIFICVMYSLYLNDPLLDF